MTEIELAALVPSRDWKEKAVRWGVAELSVRPVL